MFKEIKYKNKKMIRNIVVGFLALALSLGTILVAAYLLSGKLVENNASKNMAETETNLSLEKRKNSNEQNNSEQESIKSSEKPEKSIIQCENTSGFSSDDVLDCIAKDLRAGDVDAALKNFSPDKKREDIMRLLDADELDQFAYELENAVLVEETQNIKFYEYRWVDDTGEKFMKFTMSKNVNGNWVITNW